MQSKSKHHWFLIISEFCSIQIQQLIVYQVTQVRYELEILDHISSILKPYFQNYL